MSHICYDDKLGCNIEKCERQSGWSSVFSICFILILGLLACYIVQCDGIDKTQTHPCSNTCLAIGFTKARSVVHSAWSNGGNNHHHHGKNDDLMCRRKCRKSCRKSCRGNRKCKHKCKDKCKNRCSSFFCHGVFRICVIIASIVLSLFFFCLMLYTYYDTVQYKKNYD